MKCLAFLTICSAASAVAPYPYVIIGRHEVSTTEGLHETLQASASLFAHQKAQAAEMLKVIAPELDRGCQEQLRQGMAQIQSQPDIASKSSGQLLLEISQNLRENCQRQLRGHVGHQMEAHGKDYADSSQVSAFVSQAKTGNPTTKSPLPSKGKLPWLEPAPICFRIFNDRSEFCEGSATYCQERLWEDVGNDADPKYNSAGECLAAREPAPESAEKKKPFFPPHPQGDCSKEECLGTEMYCDLLWEKEGVQSSDKCFNSREKPQNLPWFEGTGFDCEQADSSETCWGTDIYCKEENYPNNLYASPQDCLAARQPPPTN
ncbi:hypothetical protein ETB97_005952 [Aspergillus alliaceus]|uniref:Uncharacterized protein n=1 Tax=Petromyces alliaceus TaxID=209559 RepID=A0A8H5ZY15_PETAA|nr:hypothetical protein ETB97_005952 [Aspergillus burnettii]